MSELIHKEGSTVLTKRYNLYLVQDTGKPYYLAKEGGKGWQILNRMATLICEAETEELMLNIMKELTKRHELYVQVQIKEYGNEDRLCSMCGVAPLECLCFKKEEKC